MAKIRILMFGWELPPSNSGGLGTASAGIATALSLLDFDLTFVLPTRVPISDFPFKVIFADELEGSIKDDGKLISAYARPGKKNICETRRILGREKNIFEMI